MKPSPSALAKEMGGDMKEFYSIMGDFYNKGSVQRHSSPTKRLIQQKNACHDHKRILREN